MAKDKKRNLTPPETKLALSQMKELFAEDIEQDSDPQSRKLLVIRNYVVKLGEADWCNILQIREDQNWPEAELQAKLIYRRLVEIEKSSSPATSGARYAPTRAGNSTTKWHINRGLYTVARG